MVIWTCQIISPELFLTHSSKHAVEDVEIGFTQSNGNLGNRLLSALEASETEARERKTSAALLVAKRKQPMTPFSIQLRVDFHVDPIKQLRIIYDEYMHTYSCE